MSDLVKRLRWGWPETEILSKDMPRIRRDAIEAADRIEALEARVFLLEGYQYPHKCDKCGVRQLLRTIYPHITYEDLPAPPKP